MTTKDEWLAELIETKYSIQNNKFNPDMVRNSLQKIDSDSLNKSLFKVREQSNLIKSFLITFNVNNFSDLTLLFITTSEGVRIIEYAGTEILFNEFKNLIETDQKFYEDIDKIKVKENSFRIFFESMENDNGLYTVLTITESVFFKPSKFHMLSDILLDIVRSSDISRGPIVNDLFENTVIEISSYISTNNITESEVYLFKFENIYDFFLKMGLEIIIELSETIKKRLWEFFGDKSGIFRFSLSEYIVISSGDFLQDNRSLDLNNSSMLDFIYKGIVLHHRCIKIPYKNNQSIYDIFENISLIIKNKKSR